LANARRLGEECVELAPPEDIGSLDIDDVAMIEEQWPDGFREANVDACLSDDVSIASSDGTLPVARVVDSSPTPLALVRSSPPPSPAPMQTPVSTRAHLTSPTWADVRVNLSVPYAEIDACERAGATFDTKNGIYFCPPRVDLRPVMQWLPFDLTATFSATGTGLLPNTIPRAVAGVKADGSPDFRLGSNVAVRNMLSPPPPPSPPPPAPPTKADTPPLASHASVASNLADAKVDPTIGHAGAREVPFPEEVPPPIVAEFGNIVRSLVPYVCVCLVLVLIVITISLNSLLVSTSVGLSVSSGLKILSSMVAAAGGGDSPSTLFSSWCVSFSANLLAYDPSAWGVIMAFLLIVGLHRDDFFSVIANVVAVIRRRMERGTLTLILLAFMWFCLARGTALSTHDHKHLVEHFSENQLVIRNLAVTESLHVMWHGGMILDYESFEDVALVAESAGAGLCIWDTGAKRGVRRDRSTLLPGTSKPCPFRIRSVLSGTRVPECMGDVRTPLPVDDGTVRVVVERDVVILADAPHDIISPGRLEKANVCKWDGTFNDGKRVVLINDGFLRVPLVDPLRSTHEFTSTTACTSKVPPPCRLRPRRIADCSIGLAGSSTPAISPIIGPT